MVAVKNNFDEVALGYADYRFIEQHCEELLLERLSVMNLSPKYVLDLGSGLGMASLSERFRTAQVICLDLSREMLLQGSMTGNATCADASHMPFRANQFDLVISNLLLPWVSAPQTVIEEVSRVLSPGGLFLFSSLGPDTLWEIDEAWAAVGIENQVNPQLDMHELGDMLQKSHLSDPVVERHDIFVQYDDYKQLAKELSLAGSMPKVSRATPIPTSTREAFIRELDAKMPKEYLTVTYELVFGHAWRAAMQQDNGEVRVALESIPKRKSSN